MADNGAKAGSAAEDKSLTAHGLRPHCARPEMKTCSGSLKTMTCEALVNKCKNTPSNQVWQTNHCAGLKRLVKF